MSGPGDLDRFGWGDDDEGVVITMPDGSVHVIGDDEPAGE